MPIVGVRVRGEPVPGAVVAEAHPYATRPVVARHEPPHIRVEVPAGVHEHVVHALDHAVAVDPHVLTVGIGPVPVHPDPVGTDRALLDLDDRARRGRRVLGRRSRVWLLHDDDGFPVDLVRASFFHLDDDVVGRIARLGGHRRRVSGGSFGARVAVVRHIELLRDDSGAPVPRGSVVVRTRPHGAQRQSGEREHRRNSNESRHASSCSSRRTAGPRHPQHAERARPARQGSEKVLGLPPLK
jgi:hypothetical protein